MLCCAAVPSALPYLLSPMRLMLLTLDILLQNILLSVHRVQQVMGMLVDNERLPRPVRDGPDRLVEPCVSVKARKALWDCPKTCALLSIEVCKLHCF